MSFRVWIWFAWFPFSWTNILLVDIQIFARPQFSVHLLYLYSRQNVSHKLRHARVRLCSRNGDWNPPSSPALASFCVVPQRGAPTHYTNHARQKVCASIEHIMRPAYIQYNTSHTLIKTHDVRRSARGPPPSSSSPPRHTNGSCNLNTPHRRRAAHL